MRLILALGNPGQNYRDTRHNIGWWLADRLARAWKCPAFRSDGLTAWTQADSWPGTELHKPLTYMNRSGDAVRTLLGSREFDPNVDLLVLVDEVALPPGRLRVRARGSAGGHNGLASISAALGSDRFSRIRIGVGRPQDHRIDLADWVLARMGRADEEAALAVFPKATAAIEHWLEHGIEAAMNRFNSDR